MPGAAPVGAGVPAPFDAARAAPPGMTRTPDPDRPGWPKWRRTASSSSSSTMLNVEETLLPRLCRKASRALASMFSSLANWYTRIFFTFITPAAGPAGAALARLAHRSEKVGRQTRV